MSTDTIQEFIIKNEQNLRIAVAVSEAWPEARNHIMTSFLDRLATKLRSGLQHWQTEVGNTYFVDRYAGFQLSKANWDAYWVDLQFADYGQKVQFGIMRNENEISNQPFCPAILEAVSNLYPSAKQVKWWEAVVVMSSPATDWRTPDVLWRMQTDSSFLEDVAGQLLSLANATESIVDRLAKKVKKLK